jgi:hypothetical protein
MRLSSFFVAVILLSPTFTLAQHSSSAGASSSGSSGFSTSPSNASNASYSSYSGGSSSVSSHSSSSSAAHSSNIGSASRSGDQPARSNVARTIHEPSSGGASTKENTLSKSTQPEKKNPFSFFAHLLRRRDAKPKAEADLVRPPKCKHGPCPVPCPSNKLGACAPYGETYQCRPGEYWNGSVCAALANFRLSDCSTFVLQLSQQAKRMQLAESEGRASCSRSPETQECAAQMIEFQNQTERYRALQQQYEECQRRILAHDVFGRRLELLSAN